MVSPLNKHDSLLTTVAVPTELGQLPGDWQVKSIGALATFITSGGRGWAKHYAEFGSLFIRITNLTRAKIRLDLDDLRFVQLPKSEGEARRTCVHFGDVLISITADIGIIGYVDELVLLPAYINQHIALVRFDAAIINSQYASYFLAAAQSQKLLRALTDSGAKAGMNLSTVHSIKIAAPPTINEQTAIADALHDADASIETLEQFLAKKRQIKQGAMQELLSGKRRLAGHTDDWAVKLLGELLRVRHGKDQKNVESTSGTFPILATGGQIGWADKFIYDKPSLLIGRKGTINKPRYIDMPFWTVDTLFYSEIKEPNCAKFLYYRACLIDWMQYNEASGVPSLSARTIEAIEILCPIPDEQEKIADYLSDMDAEITTIETKLTKARHLKQAMMQKLLTGQIRLVPPSPEEATP